MSKINLLLCFYLAVLILLIPLIALGAPAYIHSESSRESISSDSVLPETSAAASDAEPSSMPALSERTLVLPQADSFTIYDLTTGELHKMTAAEYTVCAVSAEMPPTFSEEALRAQAVACYTYALRAKYDNQDSPDAALQGADFAADPSNWKGFSTREQYIERYGEEKGAAYWQQLEQAVEPVLGYVMLYQDRPIIAAFHSISCGMTEEASNVWNGTAPYLVPVESPGDQYAPGYETAELFEPDALAESLAAAGLIQRETVSGDPKDWFSQLQYSPSGYVESLQFCGQTLDGMDVRNALELRSSSFTVEYLNSAFLIRVCGYGHGVGMSQYGAEYLGKQGKSWDEILQHYYTGIEIYKLEDIADSF